MKKSISRRKSRVPVPNGNPRNMTSSLGCVDAVLGSDHGFASHQVGPLAQSLAISADAVCFCIPLVLHHPGLHSHAMVDM